MFLVSTVVSGFYFERMAMTKAMFLQVKIYLLKTSFYLSMVLFRMKRH